ncbi:hypothetical protein H9645_10725 [Luteimonas sp. Sa2BVA3]|uniref:DUF4398 domain-containing protein n=1 Tax=Luteimonas colneyensis TaxID=2762230 RepID=A0ABR8UL22_9GAMM|nr:hypothetical protein [Luteimonas colneyensis]MBD7988498.1 hypothetical protein [Luteimonas colneyensis]
MSRIVHAVMVAALLVPGAALAQSRNADDGSAPLQARLQALDADPERATLAAYERLRARQALEALAGARGAQAKADARQVAEWRIETAEIAAATGLARRQIDRLDRERSELLVEASRQDAARARAEAERLRIQAQIQAEEAERLRLEAEMESGARQRAEGVLDDVAKTQADRLRAAREREAELKRQEAELLKALED